MKTITQLHNYTIKNLILLIALAFIAISCSSDDDSNDSNPTTDNNSFLKVGDEEFELKSGTLINWGSYEGSIFDFVLNLYSSDFTLNQGEPNFEDNVVTGISMDLYANSPFDLAEANYEKVSFDNISGNSYQALDLALNIDIENETGTTKQIVEGTFTVLSAGSNYELEFTGTDNEGDEVTFFYEGELSQIDNTEQ